MSEQTYMPGMEPQIATGAWTSDVAAAKPGSYLVLRTDDDEMDVFLCDGDGAWIDPVACTPEETPRLIAPIFQPEAAQ